MPTYIMKTINVTFTGSNGEYVPVFSDSILGEQGENMATRLSITLPATWADFIGVSGAYIAVEYKNAKGTIGRSENIAFPALIATPVTYDVPYDALYAPETVIWFSVYAPIGTTDTRITKTNVIRATVKEGYSGGTVESPFGHDIIQQLKDLIDLRELLSNKVTSFSSPTDVQYPSAKLVDDRIDIIDGTLVELRDDIDAIVTNASIDPEVAIARISTTKSESFITLDDRLEDIEQKHIIDLGLKADTSYVDTEIAAIASGSPAGVYATTAALDSAHPTGDANIYVVTADGKWYYWNGSAWTAGGVYQSTGIADDYVEEKHMNAKMKKAVQFGVARQDDVAGVGVLPFNTNTKEGTSAPLYFPTTTESSTIAGVNMVLDSDSPMRNVYGYKRQIFRTGAPGSTNVLTLTYMPSLSEKPEILCFGFWVKDSDVNTIYDAARLAEFWLYNTAKYIKITFDLKALIVSENTTVPITATIPGAGIIDSYSAASVCLDKCEGYSFVRITLSDIVWNSSFTALTEVIFYYVLTPIKTQLVGAELNISNFTMLYDALITSGYYAYPDGTTVPQYPTATGIQEQIDSIVPSVGLDKYFSVTIDTTRTNDVAIRTKFNTTKDLVQLYSVFQTDLFNSIVEYMQSNLILSTDLSPYVTAQNILAVTTDDACPINFNGSYIGGNHGQSCVIAVVANTHGKTFADISSEWTDGDGRKWYLIKIVDVNTMWFVSENIGTATIYSFDLVISGSTLTHSTGAEHDGDITIGSSTVTQLRPSVANQTKKVFVDGQEVTANSTYHALEHIDIVDEYDIMNPSAVVQYLIDNKPVGGYISNPALNVGDAIAHYSILYRHLYDGTVLITSGFINYKDITLVYFGAVQSALPSPSSLGGSGYKYIPKALPRTIGANTYEFRTPRSMAIMADSLDLTSSYWEVPSSPPDRTIDLISDGAGDYKAGFEMGYLPVAYGSGRSARITNAWNIFTSKKSYPHLIDIGNPLTEDSCIDSVSFRKWFDISPTNSEQTALCVIPGGKEAYVFIDYHGVIDDYVTLPKEYIGKSITVVEKSSNVTLYGTIVTDRIRVKVTTATPLYGYLVLKLS